MLTSEVRPAEARFELTLAFHCAPALAGIKPADLIALPGEGDETDALLASYSAALAGAGSLCGPCAGAAAAVWYWCTGGTAWSASWSRRRWPVCWNGTAIPGRRAGGHAGPSGVPDGGERWVPHEVGLFLGYPAEDVEGFRRHGGQGYKYSGLWKVYSDVERAQRCFRQYGCCRRPCAAAWRPAVGWSSCFGQLDGDRG